MYVNQLFTYFNLYLNFQIDTDFAQKYPESSNHLFRNFDTLMKNVLLHLPEKSGGSVLKSLLNKLNEEFISGISFMIVITLNTNKYKK